MGEPRDYRPINRDVAKYFWLVQRKVEQATGQPLVKSIYDFQSDSDLNDSIDSNNPEEVIQEVSMVKLAIFVAVL